MKRLVNGNILIRFDSDFVTTTAGGLLLSVDYEPEFHQCVTGTVMQICEEKFTTRDWLKDVPINVEVGDRVAMKYTYCQTALECGLDNNKLGTWFIKDDSFYAVVPYAAVMAIKRDGAILAASGYVLARQIEASEEIGQWQISLADSTEPLMFEVVAAGPDVTTYPGVHEVKDLKPGDKVLTDAHCAYMVESPQHLLMLDEPLVCFDKYLVYALA